MPKSIADQVIVITGATSGIGLATAKEAARRGARVVLAARNAEELMRAVEEIRKDGGLAVAVPTDVADFDAVDALARQAVDEFGRIDTWVNDAAVTNYATFEEMPVEDFRRVVEVDLMGQVHGAKAALPWLRKTNGALVCVGSVESDRGIPLMSAYAAAKHGIKGWLDALRLELRKDGAGVRVTLVKPGTINTPLFDHARTQLGVVPRGAPPVYPVEPAVDAILYAAENDERDLYVGGMAKLLSVLERLSPRLVDAYLARTAFRQQRTDIPKPTDAPDNLYSPLPTEGGERGRFKDEERRFAVYPWISERGVLEPLAMAAAAGLGALALRAVFRRVAAAI